jgi:hypothetical protein
MVVTLCVERAVRRVCSVGVFCLQNREQMELYLTSVLQNSDKLSFVEDAIIGKSLILSLLSSWLSRLSLPTKFKHLGVTALATRTAHLFILSRTTSMAI